MIDNPREHRSLANLVDFTGARVLVTGGTRGIGADVTRRFAEAGADVVAVCRAHAGGRSARRTLRAG